MIGAGRRAEAAHPDIACERFRKEFVIRVARLLGKRIAFSVVALRRLQNRSDRSSRHRSIANARRIPIDLSFHAVDVLVRQQPALPHDIFVAEWKARPVQSDDHRLEFVTRRYGRRVIRGSYHFPDPPIVLFDGGRNVPLPAVASEEYIGDPFNWIADEASDRFTEHRAIGLTSLHSIFVKANQLVAAVSFSDGTNGHGSLLLDLESGLNARVPVAVNGVKQS